MNNSHDLLTDVKGILVKDFIPKYSKIELIESNESYKKYVNKFKAKWFKRTGKDRLNSYLEDLKTYYEELAKELKVE